MFNTMIRSGMVGVGLALLVFAPATAHHDSNSLPLKPTDAADSCNADLTQIRVTVTGATHQGLAKIELYKPEDNWLKDETRKVRVPASDGSFVVCLTVTPGTYAIAGYHDQNANRKLDKKFPVTPKEPFGVVNQNRLTKKKRPKFDQVSFRVGSDVIAVDLILVDPKDK